MMRKKVSRAATKFCPVRDFRGERSTPIKGRDYEHASPIPHRSYQIIFFHRAIYISSSPAMEGGCGTPYTDPPVSVRVRYQCICTLLEPHENNSADASMQPPRPSLFRDGQVERVGIGPW